MERERGAALVEFALVLSILVLVLFGIIEFGRAYHVKLSLTHASREGVRVLAVTQDPDEAVAATMGAAASLDLAALQVEAGTCTPGEETQVRVEYPLTYDIPLFGSATIDLTSTAVMQCGG
jgi:Flp pilus assembly protein TadG